MNLETSFAPLLDVLLKSAVILLAGAALLAAMRKASAANRHAVSVAIFAALLLLPLTKLFAPRWSLAMEADPATTVRVDLAPVAFIETSASTVGPVLSDAGALSNESTPMVIPWKTLFVGIWLVGAMLLLVRRASISLRLRALAQSSEPIEDEKLMACAWKCMEASGARGTMRESAVCRVPLVAGILRPIVLLPEDAREWSETRIAFALRHELGHIRRRDCLTRLLAEIACALYWINPLVWLAARQLRLAQEQACDDLVLNAGAPADEYAGQLVDAVRSLQADHLGTHHALAMAQPSTLETRVVAIMEPTRNRISLSMRGAFGGGALAVVMLSVCAAAQLRGAQKLESVAKADARHVAQVEIEARFFEIADDPRGLPDLLKARGPTSVSPEQAEAAIKELQRKEGVSILASPRVITKSGQKAKIAVGREFRYPTAWEKDAKTAAWKSKSVGMEHLGFSFEVTPIVTADGTIDLDLVPALTTHLDVVDLDAPQQGAMPDPARVVPEGHRSQPVFNHRKLQTRVTVKSGDSVLLGGLEVAVGSNEQAILDDLRKDLPNDPDKPDAEKRPKSRLIVLATARIAVPGHLPEKAASAKADWIYPKIDFRGATVTEIAEFLVKRGAQLDPLGKGTPIVIKGGREFADAKITLQLENVSLDQVLKCVAELANAEVVKEEFAFLLHPKAAGGGAAALAAPNGEFKAAPPAAEDAKSTAWKKAETIILPRLDLRTASLEESIEFLRVKAKQLDPDKQGVNLVLQPPVGGKQPTITINLTKIPLTEALRYIANLADYEIVASDAAILFKPIAK